jgi:hypothetical protein
MLATFQFRGEVLPGQHRAKGGGRPQLCHMWCLPGRIVLTDGFSRMRKFICAHNAPLPGNVQAEFVSAPPFGGCVIPSGSEVILKVSFES